MNAASARALASLLAALPMIAPPRAACGAADDVKGIEGLIQRGEYDKARAGAEALAARAERAHDRATQAEALLLLSDALYYLGRREQTLPIMQRALRLYQQTGQDRGIGRAWYNLAFYYERSEPERMIELLRKAAPHLERSGDLRLQMFLENAFGTAYWGLSRFQDAYDRFERAARLARRRGDERALSIAFSNMGLVERHRARYEEALRLLHEASALQQRVGSMPQAPDTLTHLAEVHWYLGDIERAVALLERALQGHRAFGSARGQSAQLEALAALHEEAGDGGRAERLRREALRLSLEIGDDRRAVTLLAALARQRAASGRFDQARADLAEAHRRAQAARDPGLRRAVAEAGASLELEAGAAPAALEWARRAQAEARRVEDPQAQGQALALAAQVLERLGRREEAAAAYARAIALHENARSRRYLHLWHGRLAGLYAGAADDARARAHYERSVAHVEQLDRLLVVERFRLRLFHEVAEVFRGYALWLARHGEPRRAWQVLERGRARVLHLRLLQSRGTELTGPEREALGAISALQKRLREDELAPAERRAMLARLASAEDGYERARPPARRPPAADLEPPLAFPQGALVVAYGLAGDGLLVLAHRDGRVTARVVPPGAGVAELAAAFRATASGPTTDARGPSSALYRLLLEPELSEAAAGRLIVVPDGFLHQVPFAALVDREGAYLAQRFALSLAASLSTLAAVGAAPGEAGRPVLAVANTRFAATAAPEAPLRPLQAAGREARDVASRARESVLLLEATEPRVKRLPLERFQLIHFASHVIPDEANPERSSIVVAPEAEEDGLLQAREIERLRLRSPLVVVSGCRSAGGRPFAGEGTLGLTQALYAAGARSQVLSLWDVEDEATAALMAAFYDELARSSVAEALQAAQARLIRSRRWSHPAHWAGFFVSGDGAQRVDLRRRSAAPLVFVAALALIGSVLAVALRRRARPARS